jgi:hypothetical protein
MSRFRKNPADELTYHSDRGSQYASHAFQEKTSSIQVAKSGVVAWEEINGVPIYDKNGHVIGLRGTGLNISECKEMGERGDSE